MQEPQKEKAMVGVSVLVKKGDRILLEKRQHTTHGNGTWGPPSGHIDCGEAPEQAAIRETQEETGVKIDEVNFRAITTDGCEQEHKHYIPIWLDANCAHGQAGARPR